MPTDGSALPDFPVDGNSPIFDLALVPLWRELLNAAGLNVADVALREQFRQSIDDLVEKIGSAIGDYQAGYLVRVNIWVDPDGEPIIPASELITPIGLGIEPIDALAAFFSTPESSIVAPAPHGEDRSFFFWFTSNPEPRRLYVMSEDLWGVLQEHGFESSAVEQAIRMIASFIGNSGQVSILALLAPTVAFSIKGNSQDLSGTAAVHQLAILREVPNSIETISDESKFIVRSDELGLASGMIWLNADGDAASMSIGVQLTTVNVE